MDFMEDALDSPLSGNMSSSTVSSIGETPPRGMEGLRRKLKLQQIHSAKPAFFDRQTDSNDNTSGSNFIKSATIKRKFQDQYTTFETIGQGSCGIVKKVQCHEDNQIYVAKIVRGRDHERIEQVKREFQILSRLQHKNIITAKELFLDEAIGNAQLILEYFPGQTLEDMIMEKGQLDEKMVKHIVEQLISALKHVHDNGVCHRDITATNILINQNYDVKLIDFSVSKIYKEDLWSPVKNSASLRKKNSPLLPGYHNYMLSNTGTAHYKAPEIVTSVPYNHSVDMWSLGVITFYALAGYKPFQSKHLDRLYEKISNAEYQFDPVVWENISYEAILFVKACLKQYSFVRLSTKEAMYQPWIRGIKLNNEEFPKERRTRVKHLSPLAQRERREERLGSAKPRKSFALDITSMC